MNSTRDNRGFLGWLAYLLGDRRSIGGFARQFTFIIVACAIVIAVGVIVKAL